MANTILDMPQQLPNPLACASHLHSRHQSPGPPFTFPKNTVNPLQGGKRSSSFSGSVGPGTKGLSVSMESLSELSCFHTWSCVVRIAAVGDRSFGGRGGTNRVYAIVEKSGAVNGIYILPWFSTVSRISLHLVKSSQNLLPRC